MSEELQDVIYLTKKAGKKVLEIYERGAKTYIKQDQSPVTEADFASEAILLSGLKKYGYKFLSEETEDDFSRLEETKLWIIDPIDGTQDFIAETGDFSIMVALVEGSAPVVGVVYKPIDDKLYFAQKGKGAFLEEKNEPARKLKVSSHSSLPDARLVMFKPYVTELEREFIRMAGVEKIAFRGSIGVKLGIIAEGEADGYVTMSSKTSQWDICAPQLILEEAGGKVTDTRGEVFSYNRRDSKNIHGILASNKKLHSRMLEHLNCIDRK